MHGLEQTITLVIEATASGRYRVRLEDGRPILACSRQPFCDAARVLVALGHAPTSILMMKRQ
jgi:hypothetical protein